MRTTARSRNIKPGFFLNDELAELEPLGRILFAGLWTIADREGRLEDRPLRIKASVLPYDECNVNKLLNELAAKGFITRYEVGGKEYIAIVKWKRHQNPHKNEQPSTIPAPCENGTSTVHVSNKYKINPAYSLNMIPDSLNPDPFNMIPDSSGEIANDDDHIQDPGEANLFFEQELGRPLSPTEFELVNELSNLLGLEMFKLATKRAVANDHTRTDYLGQACRSIKIGTPG